MPLYEYFCPSCRTKFELLRPMKLAVESVACPAGHQGAERTISMFAAVSRDEYGEPVVASGACGCGGSCSCGA